MNRYDGIDKRIVSNVKQYAKNLKRNITFRFMSIDDIEQELICEILACMDKFDSRCGELEHFIRKVLSRRCANLLETYTRKKRDSIIKFSEYSDEVRNDRTDDIFSKYQTELEKRTDVCRLISEMPIKYRLLYRLLLNHSIADTSKIIGISRFTILRDLKHIAFAFRCMRNPENQFWCFSNRRVKPMGRNLSTIETLDVKDLSKLEIFDLADLNEQLTKLVSHTKELKEKFDDALNLRFSETVRENLKRENKDTGTAKFFENGLQITAEVPKKVTWDSEKIGEIMKTISEEKRKAIVKTTHVIEERKYSQLSPEDKKLFSEARTVTPGKTRFQIALPEEDSTCA
ncbi:MAG: hypothetical protein IJ730_04205 [Alphaproteobacteria bacterium]|nr:hypothetical protein [Alphaproteobacteria bacterium]